MCIYTHRERERHSIYRPQHIYIYIYIHYNTIIAYYCYRIDLRSTVLAFRMVVFGMLEKQNLVLWGVDVCWKNKT